MKGTLTNSNDCEALDFDSKNLAGQTQLTDDFCGSEPCAGFYHQIRRWKLEKAAAEEKFLRLLFYVVDGSES